MLSFKTFIKEEKLRQGLPNIHELPYERLGNFLKKSSLTGIITPKTDGAAGAVGWDKDGFYTQSGRSDKIRNSGAYSEYTRQKRGEDTDLTIPSSYDTMHEHLQNNKKLTTYLRSRYESGQPSSLKGEFFLKGLAKPTEKGLKFVATSYNPSAMGETGMFILHHKLPENVTHDPDEIEKLGDHKVTFDHDRVGNNRFSVNTANERQLYDTINPEILKSRKKNDVENKLKENEKLSSIKSSLESKLKSFIPRLKSRSWEVPGETEGHVIHVDGDENNPNGDRGKIQSQAFSDFKTQQKMEKQGRTL